MKKQVVLAGACRTAIGKMGGVFSETPAVTLGATVLREALIRTAVEPEAVDHVYMGCVLQAGLGQNVARQASIAAGLPVTTTAVTVNAVCGSGLDAVIMAAQMIQAGDADVVLAGGMENMSRAPYAIMNGRFGYRMNNGVLVDTMIQDALWDAFNQYHMMITAENVAERWGLTRAELDAFSASSQQKCEAARKAKRFAEEIVPISVRKGKIVQEITEDEGPRDGMTEEKLATLKCCSGKEGGVVTAGNASGINDGAAAVLVMSAEKAEELGVTPMAIFASGALGGVDPAIMGTGPIPATRKALEKVGWTIADLDLVEANEAFASQSLVVARELGFDPKRLNVNGGAIALGHPVGASGCRILVTLLHEMQKRRVKRGLATLCIGGGMGCAVLVERWKK